MKIACLAMTDFRNYRELALRPGPGANAFLGPNGAGKTNILEGLHLVTTGLSHRTASDREMVRHGTDAFSVRAAVLRDATPERALSLQVIYRDGRKLFRRDRQVLVGRARTEALGAAVVFSPDDLDLVKGPPAKRRAFLDLTLAKADARYRTCSRRYQAALAQRNRILAEGGMQPAQQALLEPWTEQLIEQGARLLEYRLRGMAHLIPAAVQAYTALSGPCAEQLTALYVQAVPPTDASLHSGPPPGRPEIEAHLRHSFAATARDERLRGVTLAGPHRDDVQLLLDELPMRLYASQGQQRTAALALRLAEMSFLRTVSEEHPLLLLDDVFSELDQGRRRALLDLLSLDRCSQQTFFTATDLGGLPRLEELALSVFEVKDGTVNHAVSA